MRCENCGGKLKIDDQACPLCTQPVPRVKTQAANPAAKFKPSVGDQLMRILTVLVCLAYHSFGTIVGMFYFLVVLGYALDGVVWCARRIAGLGRTA